MKVTLETIVNDFTLPDSQKNEIKLSTLLEKEKVVLVFYRGWW